MTDHFHSKDVQINEDLDFSSLVSNEKLLQGLFAAGYRRPSPIQLKTIPFGRLGLDLIAQAKSGTGKTIVFSVIAIEAVLSKLYIPGNVVGYASSSKDQISPQELQRQPQEPHAVIVAPTREIAVQIREVILNLTREGLEDAIVCHAMIGGLPVKMDKENLKDCSIVVGTPGRLRALVESGQLKTSSIRLLVLDEADKLMEDCFRSDVFEIARHLREDKQVMAFSATYDDDLLGKLDTLVKNPVYIMLSNGVPELEGVLQYYKAVSLSARQKSNTVFLQQIQTMETKYTELENLLTHVPFYQAIVFLNHHSRAGDLVKFLNRAGWPAMHISSSISQADRLAVMSKARKFELRVLVCSDLIARGIDIDRVNLVVNLDLPRDPETYLHRIGRTGRYGTTGLAVSIVDDKELGTINILHRDFGITIQEISQEDKSFRQILDRSQSRHQERPLQTIQDQEQYELLKATRSEHKRDRDEQAAENGSDDKISVEGELPTASETTVHEELSLPTGKGNPHSSKRQKSNSKSDDRYDLQRITQLFSIPDRNQKAKDQSKARQNNLHFNRILSINGIGYDKDGDDKDGDSKSGGNKDEKDKDDDDGDDKNRNDEDSDGEDGDGEDKTDWNSQHQYMDPYHFYWQPATLHPMLSSSFIPTFYSPGMIQHSTYADYSYPQSTNMGQSDTPSSYPGHFLPPDIPLFPGRFMPPFM